MKKLEGLDLAGVGLLNCLLWALSSDSGTFFLRLINGTDALPLFIIDGATLPQFL